MGAFDRDSGRLAVVTDSAFGTVGAALATLLVVLGVRYGVGAALGRGVHELTYLGIAGGAVGALAMIGAGGLRDGDRAILPIRLWAGLLDDPDPDELAGPGAYVHLVFGGALGPLSTWLAWLVGLTGAWYATLPQALLPAVGYALVLAIVGFVALELRGLLEGGVEGMPEQAAFIGQHVVYGLVLGVAVGLYRPLFA
jgi:hypothetical protein